MTCFSEKVTVALVELATHGLRVHTSTFHRGCIYSPGAQDIKKTQLQACGILQFKSTCKPKKIQLPSNTGI